MVEPCYYCGEPANSVDHARPQSLEKALSAMDAVDRELVYSRQPRRTQVPACRNCNSVLGARWEETLDARRAYVKAYLRRKHAKLLASPKWTEEELSELGWKLRTSIARKQKLRLAVERRLRWPNSTAADEQRRMDAVYDTAATFLPQDRA